jgi:hypothetical protein
LASSRAQLVALIGEAELRAQQPSDRVQVQRIGRGCLLAAVMRGDEERARGAMPGNTEMASEQQISAECIPGWMASDATTPPTGIVPSGPVGQASGMIAPALITGVRISTSMLARTAATFSASWALSASMLAKNGTAPCSNNGMVGAGW